VSDREELMALRRMAELEDKAAGKSSMAPKKNELRSFIGELGLAATGGMMRGGPLLGMFGESQKQATEVLDKAAYNAGGAVTDRMGPEAGFVTNVATQAIPTVLGGMAGKATAPSIRGAGKGLMQSALKPSTAEHLSGRGGRAVQTMLDEGVNVSQGGVNKMRSAVDSLNSEIKGIIANSSATVNKQAVASRLQDVMKKYEHSIDQDDLKAIENVWTKFLTHPNLAGKDEIPIQVAQKMKQAGGAKLGDAAYGQGLKPAAERDAYKGLVRGFKEEISSAAPGVAPLNARESELINAMKIAQRRVAVDANKNPIGLGALISQPWMLPIWMWDRSPVGKSLAARGLYSGAGPIGTGAGAGLGALYGADQGMMYP
jgi:ribosomal protein S20